MIRLLIVDDEILEIEGIKSTLDYRSLGIEEVLEASNVSQAREVFSRTQVDIMLCDIEMPRGSGFELLAWVKEHSPKTECVFITCHADFSYAKKAMQLGCLDYLLKPAQPDELERVLQKALENIEKASSISETSRFSKLWAKHQPMVIEHFWLDLLNHKIPSTFDEIKLAASRINFAGLEMMTVLPILIRMRHWSKALDPRDEKIMEYGIKNIAEELIVKEEGNGIIIEMGQGGLLVLLYLEPERNIDQEALKRDCDACIKACRDYLEYELSVYIGDRVFSQKLIKIVDELLQQDRNNVAQPGRVLSLQAAKVSSGGAIQPDLNVWGVLLEKAEREELRTEVSRFLKELSESAEVNAVMLHQLQQDFIQVLSYYLTGKNIMGRQLFSDEESISLFGQATRSVRQMEQWIFYCIDKSLRMVQELKMSQTVIGKVKQYIAQNLEKELSVDEIASQVFLNPIYLTRIFKKETGLSVSEYLQHERLRIARDLLLKTSLPVSSVAAQIGYTNFSHFSRMFRKHTGLSPIDFRKKPPKSEQKS